MFPLVLVLAQIFYLTLLFSITLISESIEDSGSVELEFVDGSSSIIRHLVLRNFNDVDDPTRISVMSEELCSKHGISSMSCRDNIITLVMANKMKWKSRSHSPSGNSNFMYSDTNYIIRSYNNSPMVVHSGKATIGQPQIFWLFTDFSNTNPGLSIGRYCVLEANVIIWLGGNHCYKRISSYPWYQRSVRVASGKNYTIRRFLDRNENCPEDRARPMIIGNDVHIGTHSAFVRGVTVGDGAVIQPYSVVRKDVEPYSIVAGNPAVVVGSRFPVDTRQRLLKIRWWDWPDDVIDDNLELFMSDLGDLSEVKVDVILGRMESISQSCFP